MRRLEDQVLKEIPGSITFECELTKANVKVQWLRGKEPIPPNGNFKIEVDGAIHRLTIRDATGVNVGDYTAVARSKTSTAKLTVEGKDGLSFLHFANRSV